MSFRKVILFGLGSYHEALRRRHVLSGILYALNSCMHVAQLLELLLQPFILLVLFGWEVGGVWVTPSGTQELFFAS